MPPGKRLPFGVALVAHYQLIMYKTISIIQLRNALDLDSIRMTGGLCATGLLWY